MTFLQQWSAGAGRLQPWPDGKVMGMYGYRERILDRSHWMKQSAHVFWQCMRVSGLDKLVGPSVVQPRGPATRNPAAHSPQLLHWTTHHHSSNFGARKPFFSISQPIISIPKWSQSCLAYDIRQVRLHLRFGGLNWTMERSCL